MRLAFLTIVGSVFTALLIWWGVLIVTVFSVPWSDTPMHLEDFTK